MVDITVAVLLLFFVFLRVRLLRVLLGVVPQGIPKSKMLGLNFGHLTANISRTCKSQRYMSINQSINQKNI